LYIQIYLVDDKIAVHCTYMNKKMCVSMNMRFYARNARMLRGSM